MISPTHNTLGRVTVRLPIITEVQQEKEVPFLLETHIISGENRQQKDGAGIMEIKPPSMLLRCWCNGDNKAAPHTH